MVYSSFYYHLLKQKFNQQIVMKRQIGGDRNGTKRVKTSFLSATERLVTRSM